MFSGSDSCTHDFTVEHRVFVVFKKYWLYQDIYFSDVCPEVSPLLPFVCDFSLSDNHSNVYIAIRICRALGVRSIQIDLWLNTVARSYHTFELTNEF